MWRRPLANSLDVVLFFSAVVVLGGLLGWWSVLGQRHVTHLDALSRAHASMTGLGPEGLAEELARIDARTTRERFMLFGESALGGLMVLALLTALLTVARQRARDNQALQESFHMTAHELKTPVAGLKALLQSLESGTIPPARQGDFLKRGLETVGRLEHLTEALLTAQRAVARGGLPMTLESSLEAVEPVVERQRALGGLALEWEGRAAGRLKVNLGALRVVLENLLDNARKYGGGKVTLREEARAGRWHLWVTDAGQGLTPEEARLLFVPFERGERGDRPGAGLGLWLSRRLMAGMGGTLEASSPGPGQGTTFQLTLPLAQAGATPAAEQAEVKA